jgi:hypothetical protein
MTLVHYDAEVKPGLMLALPSEAKELHLKPGDKVSIHLEVNGDLAPVTLPNEGMLSALRAISGRQKGQRYTDASNSDQMLKEARAGAMWGSDSVE